MIDLRRTIIHRATYSTTGNKDVIVMPNAYQVISTNMLVYKDAATTFAGGFSEAIWDDENDINSDSVPDNAFVSLQDVSLSNISEKTTFGWERAFMPKLIRLNISSIAGGNVYVLFHTNYIYGKAPNS